MRSDRARHWIVRIAIFVACCISMNTTAANAETRIALVIGVSDYGNGRSLPNPVRDAQLIAGRLRSVGFEDKNLELLANPTKGQIRDALDRLYRKVQAVPDAFAMIYYAGHAVQMEGVNYLIPWDTSLLSGTATVGDYMDQGFNAQLLVDKFNRSRARQLLVVLDACRDGGLGGDPGLGELTGGAGSAEWMIAFSASPGQTASDGTGTNGPYALALADALGAPDITLTTAFERVGKRIRNDASLRGQQPYAKGSLSIQLTTTPASSDDVTSLGKTIAGKGGRTSPPAGPGTGGIDGIVGSERFARGDDGYELLKSYLAVRSLKDLQDAAAKGDGNALHLLALAQWQAPQPHRDHVRPPEGLAPRCHALRSMPNRLLLRHPTRGNRHLLALINES